MTRPIFEYACIFQLDSTTTEITLILNDLGQHGWELVAVMNHKFYFKRIIGVIEEVKLRESMTQAMERLVASGMATQVEPAEEE